MHIHHRAGSYSRALRWLFYSADDPTQRDRCLMGTVLTMSNPSPAVKCLPQVGIQEPFPDEARCTTVIWAMPLHRA